MFGWKNREPEPANIWCFVEISGLPSSSWEWKDKKMIYGNCRLANAAYAVVKCASFTDDKGSEPKSRLYRPLVKVMRVNSKNKASQKR
jgi:hypothetical protein